jgi:hypothetical protein
VALVAFLFVFAGPPTGGVALQNSLAWLEPLLLLLCGLYLLRRKGLSRLLNLALLLLCFGAIFSPLAVNVGGTHGFAQSQPGLIAGVPATVPLAWCAFVLLAVALADQLTWHRLLPAWFLSRRPVVCGVVLALLEALWDPRLLREGLLWSAAPTHYAWPLGYGPGWPMVHFLIGYLAQDLLDTMECGPVHRLGRFLGDLALLALPPAAFVLSTRLLPAWQTQTWAWTAAAWDLGASLAGTAVLLGLARAGAAWLRRSRGQPRLLLTTATAPFAPYDGDEYMLDFYSSRFTKEQGLFVTEGENPFFAGHHIARNLATPSRVLEYPTLFELEAELRRTCYHTVAIGFMNISKPKVREMCRSIRRVSPGTQIVLGGYGTVSLELSLGPDDCMDGLYDHVCREDGVAFMRRLLGEPLDAPRDCALPEQWVYPFGMRFLPQPMSPVLATLGCNARCEFCATSAFFGGNAQHVATAEEIAARVRRAYREHPDVIAVPIFDEDYLVNLDRARRVGELLAEAPELPPGAAPLSVFASLAALAQLAPADLVAMRIGYAWVGIESKFSTFSKLGKDEPRAILEGLYSHGIAVTGSFMVGLDEQTPENLDEDIEYFVSLRPATAQVAIVGPVPGTAFHQRLQDAGRLKVDRWEDQHLYHESIQCANLPPGMAHAAMRKACRRLFEEHGPSMLRLWRLWLEAHLKLREEQAPVLKARAAELARLLAESWPAAEAIRRLAPDARVSELATAALDTYAARVASPTLVQKALSAIVTAWLCVRGFRIRHFGKPSRQPVCRGYTYAGRERFPFVVSIPSFGPRPLQDAVELPRE